MKQSGNKTRDQGSSELGNSLEIRILDYWRIIKKRKVLVCVIVGIATVLSIVYSLVTPQLYKSEAIIMPIGGSGPGGGLAALAAQVGNIPMLGNLAGGASSSSQKLLALLKSRTLAENIVRKYDLVKVFYVDEWDEKNGRWKDEEDPPTFDDALGDLRGGANFVYDLAEGVITITATASSAQLAADLANNFVEELRELINQNAFTVAKKNRIFIEEQLAQNKRDLLETGKQINEFYKGGRVSNVESRVDVLAGVENEFDFGTENFITKKNKHSKEAYNELEGKKNELKKKLKEIDVVKGVPQQIYLQYLTLRRNLMGKINALLTQQYEMAKIEEAKEDLAFQVVDPAQPPLLRFKPQRKKIVMMAFIGSSLLAIFLSFMMEYVQKMRKTIQADGQKTKS